MQLSLRGALADDLRRMTSWSSRNWRLRQTLKQTCNFSGSQTGLISIPESQIGFHYFPCREAHARRFIGREANVSYSIVQWHINCDIEESSLNCVSTWHSLVDSVAGAKSFFPNIRAMGPRPWRPRSGLPYLGTPIRHEDALRIFARKWLERYLESSPRLLINRNFSKKFYHAYRFRKCHIIVDGNSIATTLAFYLFAQTQCTRSITAAPQMLTSSSFPTPHCLSCEVMPRMKPHGCSEELTRTSSSTPSALSSSCPRLPS